MKSHIRSDPATSNATWGHIIYSFSCWHPNHALNGDTLKTIPLCLNCADTNATSRGSQREESFMFLSPGMSADETEQQGRCCFLAEEPRSFCEEWTQQWKCLHACCKTSCDYKAFLQFSYTLKAKPQKPECHVTYYQYLPLWWAESLARINTGLCGCVSSLCLCVCVWVICIVLFMFYVLAVKKRWDKSRENFHSAGIKSGFYSKLACMTAANCNALTFQEQKHLLLQRISISLLDIFSPP